jgi:tripartite-type tricarboxylate transporter receptor subunit TctC
MNRRDLVKFFGASAVSSSALAQQGNANAPYKLTVGFAAGGGTDILARLAAKHLESLVGSHFIVENKTGASGSIAASYVAKTPPDKRTLLVTSDSHVIYPHTTRTPNYEPVAEFTAIAGLAGGPQCILCHPDSKFQSIAELIQYSNNKVSDLTYASGGTGTLTHMVMELLKHKSGIQARHIPFRGSAPSLPPVMAGEISLLSSPLGMVLPHIQSGRLKALAVTSKQRSPLLPNVPTISETAGLSDYEAASWVGIIGPKGMQAAEVDKLNKAIAQFTQDKAFLDSIQANAWSPIRLNPKEFSAFITAENKKWAQLIAQTKIDFS